MVSVYVDPPPLLVIPFDPRRLIPRDSTSYEDWCRRRHLDLPHGDEIDLAAEASAILRRLPSIRDAGDRSWLRDRWQRIRDELAARRRGTPTPTPPQPNARHEPAAPRPSPAPGLVVAGVALPHREGRRRGR
jgi:hypothetical protein